MEDFYLIEIITAVDSKGAIGMNDGSLLFNIKEDLKRYKESTLGNIVIYGRKTFESVVKISKGKALSGRTNVVLTRNKNYKPQYGEFVFHDIEQILNHHKTNTENDKKIMVAGGGEIYKLLLPHADSVRLTYIQKGVNEAEVFFPIDYLRKHFHTVEISESYYSEKYDAYYKFIKYERNGVNENCEGNISEESRIKSIL